MLKFFFWILLLANAGLFMYRQGDTMSDGREPARMSNQLNADKVKLMPAAQGSAASSNAPREVAVAPPQPAANKVEASCTEIGNFAAGDARRFEARLAAQSLGDRVRQRNIQEIMSHVVYIPPQGGKEEADKKVEELRRLGIDDIYIIQDDSSLRWAISLGVFKEEERARAHLAELTRKGVRSARIGPHSVGGAMVTFQLRDLDADAKARLERIKEDFPKQEIRGC
ncbi:MAG: hypothetical protein V7606_4827 [Burkholderiales bacterium]